MSQDTVYVVENHRDDYHGPHNYKICQSIDTAMGDIVPEFVDDRHEDWRDEPNEISDWHIHADSVRITLYDNESGWIVIREKELLD